MAIRAPQLAAISRLFSATVFREMAAKGRSPTFARLYRGSILAERSFRCVGDVFEAAFEVLKHEGCRDEYIYKSALTHKVLLGTHSLRTACMMNEFRVGDCKADLVILNGTATVYEIKSERDSLSRLEKQIAAYRRVFARAYVIAGESHIASVLSATPEDVGVLRLSRRYRISTVREAKESPDRVCADTVFESIRTDEAKHILLHLGFTPPKVPNTQLRRDLRAQFSKLDPSALHSAMVQTLKASRSLVPLAQLIDDLPPSLHSAALSISVRRVEHQNLLKAVKTRTANAIAWA